MNRLENIYELMGLFSAIPVGTEEKIVINNTTITLSKTTDAVNVLVKFTKDNECPCDDKCHESFDDTIIKEKVAQYKENINVLDSDIFLECLEEFKENMPLKELSDLLDKEHYTEEEAMRVDELIDTSTLIIHQILQEWLEEIVDEYEEITNMIEKFK